MFSSLRSIKSTNKIQLSSKLGIHNYQDFIYYNSKHNGVLKYLHLQTF